MDIYELPDYLTRVRTRIAQDGPTSVAYAMAREFHAEVTDSTLTRYSHQRFTQTPSPAGEPPALIRGHLKRSVRLYPARRVGAYVGESKVIPLIKYARIQEMGGTITPHGHPYLKWKGIGGKTFYARSVTLPPRPYMRPTHRKMVQDGRLRKAAAKELQEVVRRAIAGG